MTPFDDVSADLVERLDCPAIKIASHNMTNLPLLDHVARKRRPILLSTELATHAERHAQQPALARRLGLRDAIVIALASMIGAGVFAVWHPAAQAAGAWLLAGLAVAAFVAYANASSTGQLAARYPESGGAYRYGRERLGAWPGFLAGWGFVVGKTASCAAMAMTAADYLVPTARERPVAVAAVLVLAGGAAEEAPSAAHTGSSGVASQSGAP